MSNISKTPLLIKNALLFIKGYYSGPYKAIICSTIILPCLFPCTKYYSAKYLYQALGAKYFLPSTCTKCLVAKTWYQVPGTKYLRSWYQVFVPSTHTQFYQNIREIGIPNNSRKLFLRFIYQIWYIGLDL